MTLSIIALNLLSFAIFNLLGTGAEIGSNFAALAFGHVPSVANEFRTLPVDYQVIPQNLYDLTSISSAFMHADIWHLGGNMLFLWVFGDNVEDAMGHFRYLIFYLACAFAAAWFHTFVFPQSDAPLIGASGAAAGIVAAYLMLHPKVKIWVLIMARIPIRLPAAIVLSGWVLFQVAMFLFDNEDTVSWASHLGGIIAGILLVGLLKRKEVALFDRNLPAQPAEEPPQPVQEEHRWGR